MLADKQGSFLGRSADTVHHSRLGSPKEPKDNSDNNQKSVSEESLKSLRVDKKPECLAGGATGSL